MIGYSFSKFVAQIPTDTSFRPKKTYIGIFRWYFEFSSTEAFRKKGEHSHHKIDGFGVLFDQETAERESNFCSGE